MSEDFNLLMKKVAEKQIAMNQAEMQQKEAIAAKAVEEIIAELEKLPPVKLPKSVDEKLDEMFKSADAYIERHGKPTIYSADSPLRPIEVDYQPDTSADEATIRAREAIIATGVFPGAEEVIRAGLLDHTHGIQSALEVQRYAMVPVTELAKLPHYPKQTTLPTVQEYPLVPHVYPHEIIARWLGRTYHKAVRLWTRYAGVRKRYQEQVLDLCKTIAQQQTKLLNAEQMSKHRMDRIGELQHHVRALEQERNRILHYRSSKETDARLSFHEMLMACANQEERDALASLAREAVVTRLHDKSTEQIQLSIRVDAQQGKPPNLLSEDVRCQTCKKRLTGMAKERFRYRGVGSRYDGPLCDPCTDKQKSDFDARMKIAKQGLRKR